MRTHYAVLISVLFLSVNLSLAQDAANEGSQAGFTRVSKKDMLARAAMAHLDFNDPFTDANAEAYRRLLVKTHKNLLPYPIIEFKKISKEDAITLGKLRNSMEVLRKSPPTWEEIYKVELKKVKGERKAMQK